METIFVIGGLGFIGVNTVIRLLKKCYQVVILDNMSRKGTDINYAFLKSNYSGKFIFEKVDIRNMDALSKIFKKYSNIKAVYHFAAQVAVTTSVVNPREDFEINALGTFNVIECIRLYSPQSIILFSSTNKVYGGLEDKDVILENNRYRYKNIDQGIDEATCLDFHSPYGCSKGTADQYVRDYSRIYNIKSVVFRQSCIYGPHQFGIEDQGWVAWFIIASVLNKPIYIYGDGKQVRDILYIDDLVDLYEIALDNINILNGKIYNIGGGYKNAISLLELIAIMEKLLNKKITFFYSDWRAGDQKVYISDIRKITAEIGWMPQYDWQSGIEKLYDWVIKNKSLLEKIF